MNGASPNVPTSNGDGWEVVASRPPGYMPMREAIRRATNSGHYTCVRTAAAIKKWCQRLAVQHKDSAVRPVKYDGQVYIHPSIHPAFSEPAGNGPQAESLKGLPAGRRNRTLAKLQVLRDLDTWCSRPDMLVKGKTRAIAAFVETHVEHYHYNDGNTQKRLKLSGGGIAEWERRFRSGGVDALAVDGRGGYDREGPSEEAVRLFWALRCDVRQFKIRHCFRMVAAEAEKHGWRWFKSVHTCGIWDRKNRNDRTLTLHQRGDGEYTAKHKAYIEPDPESFEPGEAWEADDTPLDVWVKLQSGRVIRPVLSAWVDWRSRAIVGYKLVATGTQDSVLLAFREGAKRFGLPTVAFIDNGKNYSSYAWTGGRPKRHRVTRGPEFQQRASGIFAMLGVAPRWVTPYSPNSKARVERLFRTLEEQFMKAIPSYCGNCPDNRPAAHAELIAKAVEWGQFTAILDDAIKAYNSRPHTAADMAGRTPLQAMQMATRKRVLDQKHEPFLLAIWHKPMKVGRQGVTITYRGTRQSYGAFTPELTAIQGQKVRPTYDPDDLSYLDIFTMDGRFVCRAPHNQQVNKKLPGELLGEQIRKRNRDRKAVRKALGVGIKHLRDPVAMTLAAMEHDSARRRLPDQPPPNGGPNLVPIRPPIDVPDVERQPLRKAVGAETVDEQKAMDDFLARSEEAPKPSPAAQGWAALDQWAERENDG